MPQEKIYIYANRVFERAEQLRPLTVTLTLLLVNLIRKAQGPVTLHMGVFFGGNTSGKLVAAKPKVLSL